jgi:ABC-type multidrug transport system fused ATPase/permease subunit
MGGWFLSYKIFTQLRERMLFEMRSRLFRQVNQLCLRFHGRHTSGELFNYVMGQPLNDISMFLHNLVINMPNSAATFLISGIWIFFWDWSLSLVLLVLVAGTVWNIRKGSRRLSTLFERYQRSETAIVGRVMDIFRGSRAVKVHAMESQVSAAFEQEVGQMRKLAYERDLRTHQVNMWSEGFGYICFVLLCAVGTLRYLTGHLTEGQVVGFLASYAALQLPLSLLFTMGTMHGQARAGVIRIQELLRTSSSTPDPPPSLRRTPPRRAAIQVRDLTFGYRQNQPALQDISVTIPFGQRVALVGPSGSGKSTLIKLLLRLYDPDQGAITLNGTDLRCFSAEEIRKSFGVVPQDPYFFSATLRENLLMTRPNASAAELERVCRTANAWEFIEKLPQGLDTPIGEGGGVFSGGQRQRLAIARALLHEPDYLIFDEATNALDSLNERLVQQGLDQSLSGRTSLFIAHRFGAIRRCDLILVLNHGRLVQRGTFNELASQPGLFRRLLATELSSAPVADENETRLEALSNLNRTESAA